MPATYLGQDRSRISWGAVLAGAVVAVATSLLLSLLGAAIGAGSIRALDATSTDLANYGIGAGIWQMINLALSMALGGSGAMWRPACLARTRTWTENCTA
jgi:hypothetical protein